MLKLPLCPYCQARFLYPAVRESMKNKTGACPHCGKSFRVVKKNSALLCLAVCVILLGCNFLLLFIESMNLLFLTVFTAGGVVASYFLIPFTVRYKPLK